MKITTDYMIGNTAIQIVNTGKKIKVIDVEKQKVKKRFIKKLLAAVISSALAFGGCFYVLALQNTEVILNQKVYALRGQIEQLEKENSRIQKENEENAMTDYDEILKKAHEMGMVFPTNGQIYAYAGDKSTAVRINDDAIEGS